MADLPSSSEQTVVCDYFQRINAAIDTLVACSTPPPPPRELTNDNAVIKDFVAVVAHGLDLEQVDTIFAVWSIAKAFEAISKDRLLYQCYLDGDASMRQALLKSVMTSVPLQAQQWTTESSPMLNQLTTPTPPSIPNNNNNIGIKQV